MIPEQLRRVMQEIQVADYELHASFRIIASGELKSDYITAFIDASLRRDRLMARVFSYVAELRQAKIQRAALEHRNGNSDH